MRIDVVGHRDWASIVATCLLCIIARPWATLCTIIRALILTAVLVIVPSLTLIWDEKTLCCINRLCLERLGMDTAPNNSLTVHRAMSWQEPVVSGWSQLYLADLEWSTGALQHNRGCNLAEWWLFTATWQCARTLWHCHPGLYLKVGKMNYSLGNLDPSDD